MKPGPRLPREILPALLRSCSRKLHSGRHFSLTLSAAVLIAGFNARAVLPAQQAQVDDSRSAVLVASTTASPPAADSLMQTSGSAAQASAANAPAPQDQPAESAQEDVNGLQTKRILGIIPNFRAVSANEHLPPETVKEKFIDATEDSFDYSSIFFPAVIAGYNMYEHTTPQFHEGAAGYGRYFWHSAVDQTSENFMVEFIFPTVTREDSRYYTLGHGGFIKRTCYALSRAVITRTNSGGETFNVSEIFGAGAAAGVSNLYYPSASRSAGNTAAEWAEDVGIDAGTFWFREFWPDINRHIFHNRYLNAPPQK